MVAALTRRIKRHEAVYDFLYSSKQSDKSRKRSEEITTSFSCIFVKSFSPVEIHRVIFHVLGKSYYRARKKWFTNRYSPVI